MILETIAQAACVPNHQRHVLGSVGQPTWTKADLLARSRQKAKRWLPISPQLASVPRWSPSGPLGVGSDGLASDGGVGGGGGGDPPQAGMSQVQP